METFYFAFSLKLWIIRIFQRRFLIESFQIKSLGRYCRKIENLILEIFKALKLTQLQPPDWFLKPGNISDTHQQWSSVSETAILVNDGNKIIPRQLIISENINTQIYFELDSLAIILFYCVAYIKCFHKQHWCSRWILKTLTLCVEIWIFDYESSQGILLNFWWHFLFKEQKKWKLNIGTVHKKLCSFLNFTEVKPTFVNLCSSSI